MPLNEYRMRYVPRERRKRSVIWPLLLILGLPSVRNRLPFLPLATATVTRLPAETASPSVARTW